ncbi:hypothetical protein [Phenylobacterium conjunctum]|uniref:Uncharacterized protein n=1 Tax=Phenylobacterium conjunctum TaxID=1298959 RepID=A0ABW3SZD8_9CAUL
MSKDNIVPISPEASRRLAEARVAGAFEALYEAGGVLACAHMVTVLLERLEARIRADVARDTGRSAP